MISTACKIIVEKDNPVSPDPEVNRWIREVFEIKNMCRNNFAGRIEKEFLFVDGEYWDQPAPEMDKMETIIGYLNYWIDKNEDN